MRGRYFFAQPREEGVPRTVLNWSALDNIGISGMSLMIRLGVILLAVVR